MSRASMMNERIGEYRVTDFLGAGGMGEAYQAVHSRSGQVVAIKIALDSQDVEARERFNWEAEVHSRLRHQNIVAFKELAQSKGRSCIVMEYVDGNTLSDRIRFEGPLPIREALRILASIVEAAAYLHGEGVIHRDLKSNNIKIDSSGVVKLLDFGIARSSSAPKLTQTGLFVGALESVSPEQLEGRPADERSDIFSIGGLLYEMVTGELPFEAKTVAEGCLKIRNANFTRPSAIVPETPREIEGLIARCLRKNASDRYQTAGMLLNEIRRTQERLFGSVATTAAATADASRGSIPFFPVRWAPVRPLSRILPILLAPAILAAYWFWPSSTPSGLVKAVTIRTTEGPAKVYQNDSYIGETPVKFEAATGEWLHLTIKREGYREREFTIKVGEGLNEYDYTLEKTAGAGR